MIDLRSDTVTKPTQAMRVAMSSALVGDDVYEEDPTVTELEQKAAKRMGKEAALFIPSGTMGNQVAIMTHTRRGEEIIVEADAHIFYYEGGGPAVLSGVQTRTVKGDKGIMTTENLKNAIKNGDLHSSRTGLVCLENSHNRAGGTVMGPDITQELVEIAHKSGVPVHLDGARIFNAALALNVDVKQLVAPVDSLMFCLSKGLAAPVGSVLVGTKSFIAAARKNRKLLGGGMRQVGILAAAGIVAIESMADRLDEDHRNAKRLAETLAKLPGIDIDPTEVKTNIVLFSVAQSGIDADGFLERLQSAGILGGSFGPDKIRFVTHKDVTCEQIDEAITILRRLAL